MTTLASTLVYEKKYDEAKALLLAAINIEEKVYGKQSPQLAYAMNALGMVDSMTGDHHAAIQLHQDEIAIYAKSYGDGDYRVGIATANLGTEYFRTKKYLEAESYFRKAVAIQLKARGENNVDTAIIRIKLGRTLLYERRYREAEQQPRTGYKTLKRVSPGQTNFIDAAQKDLIADYEALHEPEKALALQKEN